MAEPLRDVALGTRSGELSPLHWTWFRRSIDAPDDERTNGEPTEPEVADRTDADAASDAIAHRMSGRPIQ